jgi:hypothetical protein
LQFSEEVKSVVARAATNVLKRHKVWTVEQTDLEQEAWAYLLSHEEWFTVHENEPWMLYRRLFDRLAVIVKREGKVKDREVSYEAWLGEHDDD